MGQGDKGRRDLVREARVVGYAFTMVPWTYRFLRPLARALVRLFYRRIDVQGLENVPASGPVILAANHPNMLLDPLLLITGQPRPLSFLAKATLFKSPLFGRFLSAVGVLPVYRRKDQPDEMGKNELTFEACYRYLERGGAIGIFPEGVSHRREAVLPLKTGCARIALESEEENSFRLGVRILPVGLYYSDRRTFRADALVIYGPVIDPATHFETYHSNSHAGVRALTAELEQKLHLITSHVPRAEDEPLVACLRQFFASPRKGMRGYIEVTPVLVKAIEYFRDIDPAHYRQVRQEVLRYCGLLSALGLDHAKLRRRYRTGAVLRYLTPRLIFAVAGTPVFLWGAINNFLPYKIPAWLSHLVARDVVELATVKFASGLVSFPLFYLLQTGLVGYWMGGWAALGYLATLPISGLFALRFTEVMTGFAEEVRVFFLHLRRGNLLERLQKRRIRIVNELKRDREEYLVARESD